MLSCSAQSFDGLFMGWRTLLLLYFGDAEWEGRGELRPLGGEPGLCTGPACSVFCWASGCKVTPRVPPALFYQGDSLGSNLPSSFGFLTGRMDCSMPQTQTEGHNEGDKDAEKSESPPHVERQTLYDVEGVPMISHYFEYNERIRNFKAKPDDVLIATYPKAGTTWIIEIVDCIRKEGVTTEIKNQLSQTRAPFIEMGAVNMIPSGENEHQNLIIRANGVFSRDLICLCLSTGVDLLENMPSPRLVKTHLPVNLVPKSFWDNDCKDPVREVERVARFLGKTLEGTTINEILDHIAFSNMKDNPMTNYSIIPSHLMNQKISPFMRKGKVGDWKNHFTVAQNERFEEEYRRRMAKTSLRLTDEL
ncbi:ST1B1 Sulfotransferase, partial [Polypterus senegalus]